MSIAIDRRRIILTVVATLVFSIPATHASAQGQRCSKASLFGSYAFQIDGSNVNGPFAAVGKNTYDGNGGLSGVITISTNGTIVSAVPYKGTYTLNTDCTGTKSATIPAIGSTVHFNFVVDNNLREVRMIVTDPGFTVSGTARKVFADAVR